MKIVALELLLWGGNFFAQIPSGYYDNANGKTGDELKVALHNIITGHTTVSYDNLWDAFWSTDNKGNGVVWDMYSDIPNGTPPYTFSLGQNQCGEYDLEGDCYNREHSWPQSWFNKQTTPRCDLHHIFPTDGFVNNQRSNYPYGEVNHATWTSQNGSKLGNGKSSIGYTDKVFEPIDAYKGDFARAFFYMSVRYYSEDSNWGSSDMTNKSEIKPWAMTMLLRWSDEDPVSQKEIDRNNVIYSDYQHNRNPFIDHPEYARMIWDPNWTGGTSYNITCTTGLSHGSVSAPSSAFEGSTVAITATPDPGYMVDTYTVYKTGSPNTTVTVSSNGTFTMPGYAVTVSASFKVNNTYYTITLGEVTHGSISASASSAKSGTNINLTATPATGYSLYAWYVFKTGDQNTSVPVSGNSFVMPSFNVTVRATFVQGIANGDYVKVTSAPSDWSGEYLIVYESNNKAFNGSLTTLDANNNTISVSISSNTISSNTTTDAATFTIAPYSGGYSIKSASGFFIGNSSNSNGMSVSTTALQNTISLTNGNIVIKGTGNTTLQYNNSADRFRYYSSTQKSIQLYKKTTAAAAPTHTIHFNANGGSGTMNDQTVNENVPTALNANTFTRVGYVFESWNTEPDGTGTSYIDGGNIRLLDDVTLYAQWEETYSITCATNLAHGSISANLTEAMAGVTVTLTATPASCYALYQWLVTDADGNLIVVADNQFEMPDSDVTVSASFRYLGEPQAYYQLVTSEAELVEGQSYLIVNTSAKKALGKTQNNNNRAAVSVTIANNIIASIGNTVCELTLGGTSGAWTFFDANWGNSGGYLYAESGGNYLRTQANNDTNGQWNITISSDGVASITSQGQNKSLKYNSQNPIFACYSSGQQDVKLFVRKLEYVYGQNTTLAQGWNWWTPVIATNVGALQTAMGNNLLSIQSQTGTPSGDFVAGQMYKIQTSSASSFTLSGAVLWDVSVTIAPGLNWFGYPGTEALVLENLGITPADGDKIVGQDEGFAIFENGSWSGTLGALQPGHGYVYVSNATGSKTMILLSAQ